MRPSGSAVAVAGALCLLAQWIATGAEAQPVVAASMVYAPVTPCRIVDTRVVGGSLPADTPRDFRVTGVGLQGQGGNPAGCGIPQGPAKAAILNFVAVNPTGPGNLRAWAYATPPATPPTASVLNYAAVGLNIANAVAVPLCDDTPTNCPFDLRVQADMRGTHLVIDIVGYFYDSPLSWGAVRTGAVASINWTTIPGLQFNIRLPASALVHTVATGTQRLVEGTCHEAYRLMIDGKPLGDASHGQRIQMSAASVPWQMWSFSHSVRLAAGDHSIAVQTRESSDPLSYHCVVCGDTSGSTPAYTECSLNATAVFKAP
jgi:hypothetical protein